MPNGERAWSTIELGLNIPLFLVRFLNKEHQHTRHLLLSDPHDLLPMALAMKVSNQELLAIGLLSPDYINGSENYQLFWLTSIWRDLGDKRVFKYRCQNGDIMNDTFALETLAPSSRDFECIVSLSAEVQ